MQFATTRWSIILAARENPLASGRAFEEICTAYRAPVLTYLRHHVGDDAEDLAQEFFTQLIERRWDAAADPQRGRFRSFLLTALRRFLASSLRATYSRRRGGDEVQVDWEVAESRLSASEGPEEAFNRAWAMTVLQRALDRLREESEHAGKHELFEQLLPYLTERADPAEYLRLAERLDMRRNTIAVSVHRLRHRYRELVRAELNDTLSGPNQVEPELQALKEALGAAPAEH